MALQDNSLRLFRLWGIQVFLHWSWFLVAFYEISIRKGLYSSLGWNAAEYVALFLIVLLHEFGHSLACRQVGGAAERIVLWPLGGVAFVAPPQRPGAVLWSIAAGPLVNVALAPLLFAADVLARNSGAGTPDLARFLHDLQRINLLLLIFNLLPIYPLDGGQILRSLLWFALGSARSLFVATLMGFAGLAGLAALAIMWQSFWTGLVVFFLFSNCLASFKYARTLLAQARANQGERSSEERRKGEE